MPEWTACSSTRSSTVPSTRPRRLVVRAGTPTFQLLESATMMASARSSSRCVSRKERKVGDPASSSPSKKKVTPTPKSSPSTSSSARNEARWTMIPALSSAAPRPNSRPSISVALNGSVFQSDGSPGGCTSWCAYSRTVGLPAAAGRRATTAGPPSDSPFGTLQDLHVLQPQLADQAGDGIGAADQILLIEGRPGDPGIETRLLQRGDGAPHAGVHRGRELFNVYIGHSRHPTARNAAAPRPAGRPPCRCFNSWRIRAGGPVFLTGVRT